MKLNFLSRLYYARSDEDRHSKDGTNLGELYQQIADVDTAEQLCAIQLEAAKLSADAQETLESRVTAVCRAYEQQGFINGFRLGLMLSRELGA